MEKSPVVGKYILAAAKTFHYAGYECAAWYRDIKVEAGEYDVRAYLENDRVKYFIAALPGVVVGSDFSSHFGGVRYGSKVNADLGQPAVYHIQLYDYQVFASINEGNSPWRIGLNLIPNLGECKNCGSAVSVFPYTEPELRCPSCRVKRDNHYKTIIRHRYPRLVALLDRTVKLGDYTILHYLKAKNRGLTEMSKDFHFGQIKLALTQRDAEIRPVFRAYMAERLAETGAKYFDGKNYYELNGMSTNVNDWTIHRIDWRWVADNNGWRQELEYREDEKRVVSRCLPFQIQKAA